MHLILSRYFADEHCTLGMLFVDGEFACYILEDARHEVKIPGETRIPEGHYKLALTESPKFTPIFHHPMVEITGITGFSKCYFHPGNTDKDTLGCPLVGNTVRFNVIGPSWLEDSRRAYERVYPIIAAAIKAGDVYVDVIDLKPL